MFAKIIGYVCQPQQDSLISCVADFLRLPRGFAIVSHLFFNKNALL